jgi:hypothetical protein
VRLQPRLVKELVESVMPGTVFDVDGIPASGWPLLSAGSAVSRRYNPTPEQKLAHHTENARHKDQLPLARTRPELFRADAGKLSGNAIPQTTPIRNGRISEFARLVNKLENPRRAGFSNREFVFAYLLGSQFKSFGFNAPPTEHASCRTAPRPGLKSRFTRPYPNFPILICWGTPSFPPVRHQRSAQGQARSLRRTPSW